MPHLFERFLDSARVFADRPALEIGRDVYSYAELQRLAVSLARRIRDAESDPRPLAAFLAYRSVTAYVAVLGILGSGKGYVPLNPNFPIARTRKMLELSRANVLVVGEESAPFVEELISGIGRPLTVISRTKLDSSGGAFASGRHRFVEWQLHGDEPPDDPSPAVPTDATAYLLFTSGSTGVPKGVAVSQRNVTSYLEYVSKRYNVQPTDRFSQTFDMTFDLSVHDMFVCWTNGACLCCLPAPSLMAPAKFIRDKRLTMWFSVPSVIQFMDRMRMLKPRSFPTLRVSLFCGEPLLAESAEAWRRAAPNSSVENLYGPTEATIAISHYRWEGGDQLKHCINGIVPIGRPFSTQRACVIDSSRHVVPRGESGELCLCGSQVTDGYYSNPEKTAEQFIEIPGHGDEIHYRTGDLVREDEEGVLHYLGRIDNQIQVRGHRVELREVEHVLRMLDGLREVVAVPWPVHHGRAEAIYAFCCGSGIDVRQVKSHCERQLPEYMVPRQVFTIEKMPLNINGKVDRRALSERVEELLHEQR